MIDSGIVDIETGVSNEAIQEMARDIRPLERIDFLRAYDSVEQGLLEASLLSEVLYTARLHGRVSAIWGITGPQQIDSGRFVNAPWLAMAESAMSHPALVLFHSKRWLEQAKHLYPVLYNWVPVEDEPAQGYLEHLGFEVFRDRVHESEKGGKYFAFLMES